MRDFHHSQRVCILIVASSSFMLLTFQSHLSWRISSPPKIHFIKKSINCAYIYAHKLYLCWLVWWEFSQSFSRFWNFLDCCPYFILERKESDINFSIFKLFFFHWCFITDLKNTSNCFCLCYLIGFWVYFFSSLKQCIQGWAKVGL